MERKEGPTGDERKAARRVVVESNDFEAELAAVEEGLRVKLTKGEVTDAEADLVATLFAERVSKDLQKSGEFVEASVADDLAQVVRGEDETVQTRRLPGVLAAHGGTRRVASL